MLEITSKYAVVTGLRNAIARHTSHYSHSPTEGVYRTHVRQCGKAAQRNSWAPLLVCGSPGPARTEARRIWHDLCGYPVSGFGRVQKDAGRTEIIIDLKESFRVHPEEQSIVARVSSVRNLIEVEN